MQHTAIYTPSAGPVGVPTMHDARPSQGVLGTLASMPRNDLVLRATLLTMVLYGSTGWVSQVVLATVGGIMLLHPVLIRSVWLWLAMLGAMTYTGMGVWYSIDNHKYLMVYWVLACCMAVGTGPAHERRVLQFNARLLVALCFLLAVMWKVIGGEYLRAASVQV